MKAFVIGKGKEARVNYLAIERQRRKLGIEYESTEHKAMVDGAKAEIRKIHKSATPCLWYSYERMTGEVRRWTVVAANGQFDSMTSGITNPRTGREIRLTKIEADELAKRYNMEWRKFKTTGSPVNYTNVLDQFMKERL